jgi:hypothetical protein
MLNDLNDLQRTVHGIIYHVCNPGLAITHAYECRGFLLELPEDDLSNQRCLM